jgi:uncharacterized cupin superfamily protein
MGAPRDRSFVVPAAAVRLQRDDLDPEQVVEGEPRVGLLEFENAGDLEAGIWEHSAGTSTDVEADEVFVVISGRATITLDDGSTLELTPGDVGVLREGERTTWQIHETLRKVYLVGLRPRREELEGEAGSASDLG